MHGVGSGSGSGSGVGRWQVVTPAASTSQTVPAQQLSVAGPQAAPAATQVATRPPQTLSTHTPLRHSLAATQNVPSGETGVQTDGPYGPLQYVPGQQSPS